MELCVIEGDGVGHEVVPAATQVLKTVFPDLTIREARAGWDFFQETGIPIEEGTIELARQCGAVLYGAASSPSYPVEGYYSPIVRLGACSMPTQIFARSAICLFQQREQG